MKLIIGILLIVFGALAAGETNPATIWYWLFAGLPITAGAAMALLWWERNVGFSNLPPRDSRGRFAKRR